MAAERKIDSTQALIDRLKKEHGTIHEIWVTHGKVDVDKLPKTGGRRPTLDLEKVKKEQGIIAYLRNPTISELDATMTRISSSPVSAKLTLARTIFIGGDERLLDVITEGSADFDLQTAYRVAQYIESITGVGLGEFKTL